MSASVQHKLKTSLQGALAGGGDPATSPLYVFGPFLTLLVGAGVASVTFGAAVWLAVLTVVTVSAMYRHVMVWVTDGSGGSGLSEEEFGGWAVKINSAITVIEYTLTFLVSIAALVTFVADRVPMLNRKLLSVDLRVAVAVLLTVFVGYLVNRGPRMAARFFGPATAGVLALLWVLILSVVVKRGLHLPRLDLEAFSGRYVHFTLGGFARILALMTGIEIFANLVAAYEGTAREKSRKAFGSLVLVMGTTVATMLVVGPAILDLADASHREVSVFTQTMDKLLPAPMAYLGSIVGIAVRLSAAAASAQGIQNLFLGLRNRHYIPAYWGQRNRFDVPAAPVWIQVIVVVACFVFLGTREETYLALYAAGVFILLSMTGWATTKRLVRQWRASRVPGELVTLVLTAVAALLSTAATAIIFEERFTEGAWMYLLLVPVFYGGFGYFRARLGEPQQVRARLKTILASSPLTPMRRMVPETQIDLKTILVPLDGTQAAEASLPPAMFLAAEYGASITVMTVTGNATAGLPAADAAEYLANVARQLSYTEVRVTPLVEQGNAAEAIVRSSTDRRFDLVVLTTFGKSPTERLVSSSVPYSVIFETTPPLLLIRPIDDWRCRRSDLKQILVPLDGSELAEQCLPFVQALALRLDSQVIILSIPEEQGDTTLTAALEAYTQRVAERMAAAGVAVTSRVGGSGPSRTILDAAESEGVDLIALTSHGRGGVGRQAYVKLGSVVDKVIRDAPCPVFFVSAVAPDTEPPAERGASSAQEAR
jgi:nucleotide-binding universal stress UspA family protein